MAAFSVKGPFEIPVTKHAAARMVGKENAREFIADHSEISDEVGCYVFAIRAAKGIKPIYIGKATKSFGREIFTDHKRDKYNTALAGQLRGTPIMYFVALTKTKGPVSKAAIDEAETYLIQAGLKANSGLLNDRKTKVEAWHINGVVRSKVGKPSAAAASLKQCLNL